MTLALVSDIHSNIEGLEAILKDMKEQGSTKSPASGISSDTAPTPNRSWTMPWSGSLS